MPHLHNTLTIRINTKTKKPKAKEKNSPHFLRKYLVFFLDNGDYNTYIRAYIFRVRDLRSHP